MTQYVAFLRGINVGGRLVNMIELKACFELMGFHNVRTVLQTGNVLFETDSAAVSKLKMRIETELTKTFNYPAKVQVLTLSRLQKIVADYPFTEMNSDIQSYVIFLEGKLAGQLFKVAKDLNTAEEKISPGDGVIYWQVRKGMTLKSPVAKYLTKSAYKDFNTNRNLNTLKKLI